MKRLRSMQCATEQGLNTAFCRDSQVDIINNIHNPLEAEALFLSEKALCMPVNNGKRLKGTGSRRVLLLEMKIW